MRLSLDTERLRRILATSLPLGVRAAELFIESSVALDVEIDAELAAGGGARIEKRWESGAHLRRFAEGRDESWVLDAPNPALLEDFVRQPERIAAEWLAAGPREESDDDPGRANLPAILSDATPQAEGPWSPGSVALAKEILSDWLAAVARTGARGAARLTAHTREFLVIATDRDPARDTRRFVDATLSLALPDPSGGILTMEEACSAASLAELASQCPGAALAERLHRRVTQTLTAGPVLSGEMSVVFAPPSAGYLLHEVCGHLLEADHVLRGLSPFAGARGQLIASGLLTLADDGSLTGMRGTACFDDEGVAARRTPLIMEGTLVGFLSDRATALATDGISTGNGRRQSYRDAPMPRMTNLVIGAGSHSPEEIMRSTASGLLVRRLGRGRVDPATGRFSLAIEEGLMIEGGKAGRPIAGGILVGRAGGLLARIDAVGSDVSADRGAPHCLKDDQAIPFGMMQPTLRVSFLAVTGHGQ